MFLFVKLVAGIAALYIAIVLLIALAQDRLLFPRWAMGGKVDLPGSAGRHTIDIASGEELVGLHVPAVGTPPETSALVLGFGGNAWDADALAQYLHSTYPDRDVVVFHYRGYAPSSGHPSARALREDALSVFDYITAELAPDQIVAVGLSIGADPAVHLASQRPVAGLILVTPFDSLNALASEHYPWLPVRLLLRHRMEVADTLDALSAPVALISAAQDTIVPARRTEPVRTSVRDLILDRVILGAGHNDLYDRADFKRAMREALSHIENASGRKSTRPE